jgi:uncharacterized protein (TIGR03067 family)
MRKTLSRSLVFCTLLAVCLCCQAVMVVQAQADADKALKELQGKWRAVEIQSSGISAPKEEAEKALLEIKDDEWFWLSGGPVDVKSRMRLDPSKSPKEIDITYLDGPAKGSTFPGIYELEKGLLRICCSATKDPKDRPKEFKIKRGQLRELLVLERAPDETALVGSARAKDSDAKAPAKGAKARQVADADQKIPTLKGHTDTVWSVAFSPDAKRLATASGDKTVKVWDAATGQELLTLKGHTAHVGSVAFSPDGKRLASASEDETVKVWDAATGQEALTLKGDTAGWNPTVTVWDLVTGQQSLTFKGHNEMVFGVTFSPDGKRLASTSTESVKVWDAATGQESVTLKGHAISVAFSPDGKRLASAGVDVKVWDAVTGQELLTLQEAPVGKVREAAARTQSMNNLKQIGLAMHNHHAAWRLLPARANFDQNGKPLLSWRVHLLPYVEQQELYDQFKLDEPWDSPNNKKLIERMPRIYASPLSKVSKEGKTTYLAVTGKGAMFDGNKGLPFADVTDGLSNTIVVLEANDTKAVTWTQPEDFAIDTKDPRAGLVLKNSKAILALFGDGRVLSLSPTIQPATLRALFTRNGGEVVNPGDY